MKNLNLIILLSLSIMLLAEEKTISMQRVESLSWQVPYPVGKLVRINPAGDILAVNSTYRSVYNLSNGATTWNVNLTTPSNISEIYYSPSGSSAFVGTESHGLYYCGNTSSYTWTQILIETSVFNVAVNSNNTIFSGTSDGLYRSENNGSSWSLTYVYPLKMALTTSDVMYIEEYNNGLCRSTDLGVTWEDINFNLSKDIVINDIQIALDGTVFISVKDLGLYKLSGSTWVVQGANPGNVNSLHAGKDGYMYCSFLDKVYRKTVAASSWTEVKSSQGRMTSFSSNSGKIIAGYTDDMITFASGDSGVNWVSVGTSVYPTIYSLLNLGNYVYAGTESGLFVSGDNGTTWTEKLPDYVINSLELGPLNSILAGTSGGFQKSDDSGQTWNLVSACPVAQPVKILYAQGLYVVGSYRSLYRSYNLSTWYGGTPSGIYSPYDMIRTSAGRHYVSDPSYGIWYADNDITWIYTGFDNSNCIEMSPNGDIFAGSHNSGDSAMLKVLKAGETIWTNNLSPPSDLFDIHISTDGTIVTSYTGGFFYSVNNGFSWTNVTSGIPVGIIIEAVSRDNSGFVYAGMRSAKGLYKSNIAITVK